MSLKDAEEIGVRKLEKAGYGKFSLEQLRQLTVDQVRDISPWPEFDGDIDSSYDRAGIPVADGITIPKQGHVLELFRSGKFNKVR